jgi:histidinol-phosphate aminotransferase
MLLGKTPAKALSRIHGQLIYRQLLRSSQYWTTQQRDDYVVRRLRSTLIRAYEGTPYYRQLFDDAGFNPRLDFQDPGDLRKLPILTKAHVRRNGDRMLDHRYTNGSFDASTSGTTGEPLNFRMNEQCYAFYYGTLYRHYSWAGYAFRDPMVALRSYVPTERSGPLFRYARLENALYCSAYHLTPANCHEYIERIARFGPKLIRSYPSSLAVLAEYAHAMRERFAGVGGLFTSSETLAPSERQAIEATFGNKLFDYYGMTEPVLAMTECERHGGLHLNWEFGHAEFLPAEDLGPNEYRLVATSFHNPVMPFIRYDTGDVIRLSASRRSCSCGRNMPLIDAVSGRKDECIITPDGRRLPSVNFYSVFRECLGVAKFQIVQFGRSEISVKIALGPQAKDPESLRVRLEKELAARLGNTMNLQLEFTDRFITNNDGKMLPVIRKPGVRSVEEGNEYIVSSQAAWARDRLGEPVYKLDWNEAARVPSVQVRESLQLLLDDNHAVCWYPEPASATLLRALSQYCHVPACNIVLTHGSDLGIELVATCLLRPGDKALAITPTYDNFRAVVEQRGGEVICFDYRGEGRFPSDRFGEALRTHSARLVYLTNPNNPIGYALDMKTLRTILEQCRLLDAVLVVDEAYFEFCGTTMAQMTASQPGVVVLRTFSKAFGLAGLRIGYILASPELAPVLTRANNPKSVTVFAKHAAMAALDDRISMERYVEEVSQGKLSLYALFDRHCITYYRSAANFVLFRWNDPNSLLEFLEPRGIFVRDRSRYFDSGGYIRVTVGDSRSMQIPLSALADFFARAGNNAAP